MLTNRMLLKFNLEKNIISIVSGSKKKEQQCRSFCKL